MNQDASSNHAADQRIGREETVTVAALLALTGGYLDGRELANDEPIDGLIWINPRPLANT
jgi:hypothetical protein